jgi:hypothetical protein
LAASTTKNSFIVIGFIDRSIGHKKSITIQFKFSSFNFIKKFFKMPVCDDAIFVVSAFGVDMTVLKY